MIDFNSFIPENLLIAPDHPLAQQLESGSQATPGVIKRVIPLDAQTFWDYWWCVPNRLLLPEDVEVLRGDRDRVERILEKLVWLFGGYCFNQDSDRQGELQPRHSWQEIVAFARQQGFESYFLDIDFFPAAIACDDRYRNLAEGNDNIGHVAVEPAHWHIEFFQLASTQGGFEIQQPKTVCSCQIWMGKPFIKHLQTGETMTRYDLWVSRPLDLTDPPWSE